jgi:hypothetical protein
MLGFSKKEQKPNIEVCKTESDGYPQDHYKNAFCASTNSYNEYVKSAVVDKKEWYCGAKDKACVVCRKNQEVGAIPLKELFPSGHLYPPAGHGCTCTLLPLV